MSRPRPWAAAIRVLARRSGRRSPSPGSRPSTSFPPPIRTPRRRAAPGREADMDRRSFIANAGAVLAGATMAAPAIAQSARNSSLVFVPGGSLSVLDPLVSTSAGSVNHAYYVWDTLYSVDSKFQPQPQMVEGHTVSDD